MVNGELYKTHREAYLKLGLLENDNQWNTTLSEAAMMNSPNKIRVQGMRTRPKIVGVSQKGYVEK